MPPPPPPPLPPTPFFTNNSYMKPNSTKNSVWDRGKSNTQALSSPSTHDINYLKCLESNLESYLDSLPQISKDNNRQMKPSTSPSTDDILIDVDIESFESRSIKMRRISDTKLSNETSTIKSVNNLIDEHETASLSNFHNVRDVLLNIQRRLETYLSGCEKGARLEVNIEEFLRELDEYVNVINEKKESELRRFSENMSNQTTIVQFRNAFSKKDLRIYDTLESDVVSYYSSDSISDMRHNNHHGFIMKNCYDRCSFNSSENSCSDSQSVEYYSMLINEDRSENLLNDAPPPLQPRYHDQDKISLIFQNPDHVIKQWQKYQLNTITINPKKKKFVNFTKTKKKKNKNFDIWSFTLDYHKTRMLQLKLEKERKIRFLVRVFFCSFGVICFVLVVLLTQSFISNRRGANF